MEILNFKNADFRSQLYDFIKKNSGDQYINDEAHSLDFDPELVAVNKVVNSLLYLSKSDVDKILAQPSGTIFKGKRMLALFWFKAEYSGNTITLTLVKHGMNGGAQYYRGLEKFVGTFTLFNEERPEGMAYCDIYNMTPIYVPDNTRNELPGELISFFYNADPEVYFSFAYKGFLSNGNLCYYGKGLPGTGGRKLVSYDITTRKATVTYVEP